ncbi:MAG: hypothetical protein A2499_04955 [Stygiobacter sp. RIFOXYC12_FULL_38_8]|nr:MAG: hypothetical protein A2299_16325 [Stygiobacter sp. RIFOXYB2_FULL_37_11]OGV13474.1 MAG: hypothetical protein A2237_17020 [Stygiobacter sp. RIFOXYA2_FULL_38_8]OGV14765.1 MAG: hypothetical protein A2440_09705 [Stygiobacter sp. RIFOXYC2_FULL_38_25]OGV22301.1 MAG: hypothetical protein A2499_04955 [Stygiobacter sp. RIFOXYC12_FULL_38_8]OGV79258.1 MAG: hypothetical protein A2X65_02075 [Stygiobacter sp. GWF2_38_21]
MKEQLTAIRDEIRALHMKVAKIKQNEYSTIYNNGDVKYFEEIQGHLAMSSAAISTFVEHLDAETESKKRFATIDKADENESQLQTDSVN